MGNSSYYLTPICFIHRSMGSGGQLFALPIIYTDAKTSDFDESPHRDQIPLLSPAPIFLTQAMVQTGKLDPFLSHLHNIRHILNRKNKLKTFRLQYTYVKMIIANKQLSQTRALKSNTSLYNIHHGGSRLSDPLRRVK